MDRTITKKDIIHAKLIPVSTMNLILGYINAKDYAFAITRYEVKPSECSSYIIFTLFGIHKHSKTKGLIQKFEFKSKKFSELFIMNDYSIIAFETNYKQVNVQINARVGNGKAIHYGTSKRGVQEAKWLPLCAININQTQEVNITKESITCKRCLYLISQI